jgi:hypothetical protein
LDELKNFKLNDSNYSEIENERSKSNDLLASTSNSNNLSFVKNQER